MRFQTKFFEILFVFKVFEMSACYKPYRFDINLVSQTMFRDTLSKYKICLFIILLIEVFHNFRLSPS